MKAVKKYGLKSKATGEWFTGIRGGNVHALRWGEAEKWIAKHYQHQLGANWRVAQYTQHTTHNTQHTTHNTQHTTHNHH